MFTHEINFFDRKEFRIYMDILDSDYGADFLSCTRSVHQGFLLRSSDEMALNYMPTEH